METWFKRAICMFVIAALNGVSSSSIRPRRNADGIIVQEMKVNSSVSIRYAYVTIHSLIENYATSDEEALFEVRLPKTAFITSFEFIIDEKTVKAVIREKAQGLQEYEQAKDDSANAGYVTQKAGVTDDTDVDVFTVKVNVAPKSMVEFRLRYEELLQKAAGKYTQKLYVTSDQTVPKLYVTCSFREKQVFESLAYTTPFSTRIFISNDEEIKDDYYIRQIVWSPSELDQEIAGTDKFEKAFEVQYELEPSVDGGVVYVNSGGEFVHLFSTPCDESNIMKKDIVFVIDVSGSMDGNPIKQVRKAMKTILAKLRQYDNFNIIIFNGLATKWKTGFQQANSYNIDTASAFLERYLIAKGSTNINDALLDAVALFDMSPFVNPDEQNGKVIVFLTDGAATAGVTNTQMIRKNVRQANYLDLEKCCKATISTIAFGKSADITFLRILASEHEGSLKVVRDTEEEIAELMLVESYEEVENPYYRNLQFSFWVDDELIPSSNVTKSEFVQYDCGNELVVGGWTRPEAEVLPSVSVSGMTKEVVFESVPTVFARDVDAETLSRLVIYEKVKELLKTGETSTDKTEIQEANSKALALSLEHGFVTPLTSLVITDYSPKQLPLPNTLGGAMTKMAGTKVMTNINANMSSDYYRDLDFTVDEQLTGNTIYPENSGMQVSCFSVILGTVPLLLIFG